MLKPIFLLMALMISVCINIYGQIQLKNIAADETVDLAFNPAPVYPEKITSSGRLISPVYDPAYYLQKSKAQKINGLVLITGGSLLGFLGTRSGWKNKGGYALRSGSFRSIEHEYTACSRVAITGMIMMAGSIPYFISALKNKYKAGLKLTCQKNSFGASNKASKKVIGLTYAIPIGK